MIASYGLKAIDGLTVSVSPFIFSVRLESSLSMVSYSDFFKIIHQIQFVFFFYRPRRSLSCTLKSVKLSLNSHTCQSDFSLSLQQQMMIFYREIFLRWKTKSKAFYVLSQRNNTVCLMMGL